MKLTHLFTLLSIGLFGSQSIYSQVHTTYLWHQDQPVYWAERSKLEPNKKQFARESHDIKMSGGNKYPGSTVAHPTNDLQEIFSKADRVNAYQSAPRNAVNSIKDIADAGAQLSISGGLMDNIQSLGAFNRWGYSAGWMNPYKEAIGWKTSGGYPRLDVVGFTYDHALSPLVSPRTLKKQIQSHQYSANKYYGHLSKGYWPAECAFSERIIPTLVECGIEWSVIANSHLARTLADYEHPYNMNGNIDAPNPADQVATKGHNWFDAAIDGRGVRLAAPYCYQAHKAQYVDPASGDVYQIDVVPMCNYMSYVDGYSGANVGEVSSKIAPFNDPHKPSILLLAHDGDNAWGGGSSYYNEAVTSFSHAARSAGYEPTVIQKFLADHPVPATDIVKVEDGAWVNAENDWGHPQFINWLWPLYNADQSFNPQGWTEDARNWAVITATDNYVTMAEDLTPTPLSIQHITEGGAQANDAELAWHFYFGGLNSGFMYYGKAEDMEVKPSLTGNIAIEHAQRVLDAHPGQDKTPPSLFAVQRFPYNPGAYAFGPTSGYKKRVAPQDFHVWSFAYDVSGLSTLQLKYRIDKDGTNPLTDSDNDTYAGGGSVGEWISIDMTLTDMAADPTTDSELNFFIMPKAKAKLCYAMIPGSQYIDKLIDYYIEATDSKGNSVKSPIHHVYVGDQQGAGGGEPTYPNMTITPTMPTKNDVITITLTNPALTSASRLHWGVNDWSLPCDSYHPDGSVIHTDNKAVQSPFTKVGEGWQLQLGPFNDPDQAVTSIDFVLKISDSNWDNNGGSDYKITLATPSSITGNSLNNQGLTIWSNSLDYIVQMANSEVVYTVMVVDMKGAVRLRSQAVGSMSIARSELPEGIYMVVATDSQSHQRYSQKIWVY